MHKMRHIYIYIDYLVFLIMHSTKYLLVAVHPQPAITQVTQADPLPLGGVLVQTHLGQTGHTGREQADEATFTLSAVPHGPHWGDLS